MSGNDWNKLGRDVKDIVQNAIDTGDFGTLNRELGKTLENALGNVGQSMKNSGFQADRRNGPGTYRPYGNYRPYGKYEGPSRNLQEAKAKFALFVNTGKPRALGILAMVLGLILALSSGLVIGIVGICALFLDVVMRQFVVITAVFLPFACLGTGAALWGNHLRKQVARFRTYVRTLNGKPYGNIKELAKSVGKSEKFVLKDIKKMIDKRMFLEGHLDQRETCLIATNEAYEQYMETEKQLREQQEQEAKSPRKQLNEEARKTIEMGNQYIKEIRRSNDAIPGIEISNKMYHLEDIIRRIFQRVEQHPELIDDLHKFMDYYLPTTVKLLNAYEELDKQELAGENIKGAKQEIENTLDTINIAFENLLDSFYKETAWDVSSDISVLKTMLAQEGLTGKKDFQ